MRNSAVSDYRMIPLINTPQTYKQPPLFFKILWFKLNFKPVKLHVQGENNEFKSFFSIGHSIKTKIKLKKFLLGIRRKSYIPPLVFQNFASKSGEFISGTMRYFDFELCLSWNKLLQTLFIIIRSLYHDYWNFDEIIIWY